MKTTEHEITEHSITERKIAEHEKFLLRREEITGMFHAPKYRGLIYASIISIGVVIAVQIAMIIWTDDIPERTRLFLQGCVGLGAIIFAILVTILTYKVFSDYYRSKYHKINPKD